jgi:hypothetical protein
MTEPIGYLNYGWSFVRAAEHLHSASSSNQPSLGFPDAPPTVLVGHGIELMLNAYIWHRSGDEASFTHDLLELNEKAEKLGLNAVDRSALEPLDRLVGGRPFEARHLLTGASSKPAIHEWFAIARRLMDQIEPELAPDRVGNVGLRTRLEPVAARC